MLLATTIVPTFIESKPAEHFNKTCCGQTDQQADIVSDRAAFAAKNAKYKCKMQYITIE